MNHIVPIVDFRNPDYLNNLFLSAIEDEKKSGEKFAAYCEGVYKNKLSIESISFLLITSGKFREETAARINAKKILLLGGSIINKTILENLRTGKISFEKALWSVKDPREAKKTIAIRDKKKFKKGKSELMIEAASLIVKALFLYWEAQPRNLIDTKNWLNKIVEYYISKDS
jgi:hypothetical protein